MVDGSYRRAGVVTGTYCPNYSGQPGQHMQHIKTLSEIKKGRKEGNKIERKQKTERNIKKGKERRRGRKRKRERKREKGKKKIHTWESGSLMTRSHHGVLGFSVI